MSWRVILCGLLGIRIWLRVFGCFGCGSVTAGVADQGSALTAGHFGKSPKVTKGLYPDVRPSLRLGFLRCGIHPGGSAYGLLRCTSSRCVWLRQTVAALPPPDKSLHSACRRALRSKAVLELTLIVLSGAASPHGVCTNKIVGAGLPAKAA